MNIQQKHFMSVLNKKIIQTQLTLFCAFCVSILSFNSAQQAKAAPLSFLKDDPIFLATTQQEAFDGNPSSMFLLVLYYDDRADVLQRDHWLAKAQEKNFFFAKHFTLPLATRKNDMNALANAAKRITADWDYIQKFAAEENSFALYLVGQAYLYGLHVPQNTEQALIYFVRSAEKNNVLALNMLGKIYDEGIGGVKNDMAQSYRYFKSAAALGSTHAKFALFLNSLEKGTPAATIDFAAFVEAAEEGNLQAQFYLGKHLLKGGQGIQKDITLGVYYIIAAGQSGFTQAQELLAEMYTSGTYFPKDPHLARFWLNETQNTRAVNFYDIDYNTYDIKVLKSTAERGSTAANFMLALYYLERDNYVLADKHLQIAIKQKSNLARAIELTVASLSPAANTQAIAETAKTILPEITALAHTGNLHARYALAIFYNKGIGVTRDVSKAFSLLQQNAASNHTLSLIYLATDSSILKNAPKSDNNTSAAYMSKAFELGSPQAQSLIALAFLRHSDLEKKAQGYEVLIRALEKESITAVTIMGSAYKEGLYLPKDPTKAFAFFEQAAKSGDPYACFEMGTMYKQGLVPAGGGDSKAAEYFKRAAEFGVTKGR